MAEHAVTAWVIKEHGKLLVNTVQLHRRGAIVNFLWVHRRVPVSIYWPDKSIYEEWEFVKGTAEAVLVELKEVRQQ